MGKQNIVKKTKELSVAIAESSAIGEEPQQQQKQQTPRKRGRPRKIMEKTEIEAIKEEIEGESKKAKTIEEEEEQQQHQIKELITSSSKEDGVAEERELSKKQPPPRGRARQTLAKELLLCILDFDEWLCWVGLKILQKLKRGKD
ncbi:hypothetical protein F0562_027240 [Nyssa sinensis]|uniref:Uncharacterized protein n=1 Tax=Nyssa sinensis TaxID=561372 RepID=A0A5J5B700_9ASTE|nr:hypothetical protein F0562_027240 [Nyssa sinensis]